MKLTAMLQKLFCFAHSKEAFSSKCIVDLYFVIFRTQKIIRKFPASWLVALRGGADRTDVSKTIVLRPISGLLVVR